jgi:hypothetical protein
MREEAGRESTPIKPANLPTPQGRLSPTAGVCYNKATIIFGSDTHAAGSNLLHEHGRSRSNACPERSRRMSTC